MIAQIFILLTALISIMPETISAQAVVFEINTPIKPFKLTTPVASGGNVAVTQAMVDIETNYKQGPDKLSVSISESWFKWTYTENTADSGYLTITGNGDINSYYRVLNAVTFVTSSMDNSDRTITWNLGTGMYFSPSKHLYVFVKKPGITFTAANAECSKSSMLGMAGYLATIAYPYSKFGSTAGEQAFITSKLHGLGWIGAKDVGNDEWQWIGGPEKNLVFYSRCKMVTQQQCTATTKSCSWLICSNKCTSYKTVSVRDCSGAPKAQVNAAGYTEYSNWAGGEPNNAGGEDFGHMYGNGQWNDFADGNRNCEGYVCEYGGLENAPYVISGSQLMTPGCSKYTKDQCSTQRQCRFNSDTNKCEINDCFVITDEMACDRHPTCEWDYDPLPEHCTEDHCMMYDKAPASKCNGDPKCYHNGVTCVDKVCSTMRQCDCVKNPVICFWDPKYANAGGTKGKCMDLQYATCPAIDLLFMLDASGSMRSYGTANPRENAFYRTVEEIRKWANDAPMTGHGWTTNEKDAKVQDELNNARGFRLGLAAFGHADCVNIYRGNHAPGCVSAKSSKYVVFGDQDSTARDTVSYSNMDIAGCIAKCEANANCKGFDWNAGWKTCYMQETTGSLTANGANDYYKRNKDLEDDHFTGKINEFMDDLDWQEDFYVGYWTNLAPGLDMAAKMFSYPAGITRQKVMLIIGDGALTDQSAVNNGGYRNTLVNNLKVKVFAIVLKDSPASASDSLKQIVSLPVTTYFRNDVSPSTLRKSVLDVWCDPTSQFGAALPAPQITGVCSKYPPDSATCNDDTGCVFNMVKNTCDVSPCIQLCTQPECIAQQLCQWDSSSGMCKRKTCDDKISEATCSAIDICQ
eukprot:PhF_6_TR10996/c0_g2_i1/m.17797